MLQIFVSHNIRIRGASTPLKGAVSLALTMDNPEVVKRLKRRLPVYGLDKKLRLFVQDFQDLIVPRGFLEELCDLLRKQGINPERVMEFNISEPAVVPFGWNPDVKLREYQMPAVLDMVEAGSGILQAPAGSGKTLMGCAIISAHQLPTLWLTHTKDLMHQSQAAAERFLPDVGEVGLLGDNQRVWGSGKLIIATVQTLEANPNLVETLKPLIGTIVVDEAHHFPAPAFIDTVGKFAAKYIIGLTATPNRKDGLERYMFTGIGPIRHQVERDALYDGGSLIKPEVRFVYTEFDHDTGASDRNEIDAVDAGGEDLDYIELLRLLMADEKRAKLIAESILDNAPRNYSLVLTESVRYCYVLRDLVQQFAKARNWVVPRMAVVHAALSQYKWITLRNSKQAEAMIKAGKAIEYRPSKRNPKRVEVKVEQYTEAEIAAWQVTNTQRKEILAAAGRREIDILFSTQLAREGLDLPHLNIEHMATPKRGDSQGSENGAAVEQELGRIMRGDPQNPDKKAILFDYVDYAVGIFKDQYMSRRKVYKRMGMVVPAKPRDERDEAIDFLKNLRYDMPL